jgi:hypothetical protein
MGASGTIPLRVAVNDFLSEAGLALHEVLNLMDEEAGGIDESLRKRVWLDDISAKKLESALSSSQLNYLIFVLQTFYIINPSGLYKSMFLIPSREAIMEGERATIEGVRSILRALDIGTMP